MFIIPYDITCIDYLVHVYFTHLVLFTEDNNTRVLYERVLSSGQVPPEKSIEIWSRFLAFESEVGDLASIQKVEKRRAQAIEKVSYCSCLVEYCGIIIVRGESMFVDFVGYPYPWIYVVIK